MKLYNFQNFFLGVQEGGFAFSLISVCRKNVLIFLTGEVFFLTLTEPDHLSPLFYQNQIFELKHVMKYGKKRCEILSNIVKLEFNTI